MNKFRLLFTPGAVVLITAGAFVFGTINGIKLERKYYEDRFAKQDAYEQLLDIIDDALNEGDWDE